MKRLITFRNSFLLGWPVHPILLLTWLEQIGAWFVAMNLDWTKLPWAFAGATIATLKGKKDANGQPIHKPFWEWASIAISGTVIAMAGWKDVMNFTKLSPELSTIIAGLIGWILADYVLKRAKKQFENDELTPKP
jgi:hypothetical protein